MSAVGPGTIQLERGTSASNGPPGVLDNNPGAELGDETGTGISIDDEASITVVNNGTVPQPVVR